MAKAIWPIGAVCCLGLLLFTLAASIVLALIPLYLPNRGSDLQTAQTNSRLIYAQYSASGDETGPTGTVSNVDAVNKQFKSDLGITDNTANVEQVQVIKSATSKRRRRYTKYSLEREKRKTITFLILLTIRVTSPTGCSSSSCQTNILTTVQIRISKKTSFSFQFSFTSVTGGSFQFTLTYTGITLAVPSQFDSSSASSTTSPPSSQTSTQQQTNGNGVTSAINGQTTARATAVVMTGPMITQRPATGPMMTQPQGTGPMVTQRPLTGPMMTQPQGTGPMITQRPAAGSMVTQQQVTGHPMTSPLPGFTMRAFGVTGSLIDWTGSLGITGGTGNPSCGQTVSDGLKWFRSYSLITIGDLSTSSVVQNSTIACGSLTSTVSATFGSGTGSTPISPSTYTLLVNGNVDNGNALNIEKGSVGVGTNPPHTIVKNSNGQYTLDDRTINMNDGNNGATVNIDTTLATKCLTITTGLKALSQYLKQLTTTTGNTVSGPTTQDAPYNLNVNAVNSNGVSVFNLDATTVLSNSRVQSISVIVSSSVSSTLKLVIINLSGTSVSFNQGNMGGDWLTSVTTGRTRTVWNLPDATTITISRNWMGALLAPYANVANTAQIDGATAVSSFSGSAAINNPPIMLPDCL